MTHRHRRSRVSLALAFAALAGPAAGSPGDPTPVRPSAVPAIDWQACHKTLVEEWWVDYWGAQLECGVMLAPLGDDTPPGATQVVGLVRIKAGDPAQRQGSLFFNFGGPGGNPLDFLPGTAYLWSQHDPEDALDGDKRRLADRFDLVAVIPRGLRGGAPFACRPVAEPKEPYDFAADRGGAPWQDFVRWGNDVAESCRTGLGLENYVGTLQHVRDMEWARRALGEPVMNFLGTSYGTWVGAFYAATYPEHVGRMVLDSAMNYAGTFEDQARDSPRESQAMFLERALLPALADPGYGIGKDAAVAMARFRNMPYWIREAWADHVHTPAALAAALVMADWIRGDRIDKDDMFNRVAAYRFSIDPPLDDAIRTAAGELIRAAAGEAPEAPVDFDVYKAVVCGDTPWLGSIDDVRVRGATMAALYPASDGGDLIMGVVCKHWAIGPRWRPPLEALAKAPPLLIVQAEFDPATPLALATKAFLASPGAYMVIARGMVGHGVFGMSATPCIESAVSRYLLAGELPAQRMSACDFVPRP